MKCTPLLDIIPYCPTFWGHFIKPACFYIDHFLINSSLCTVQIALLFTLH